MPGSNRSPLTVTQNRRWRSLLLGAALAASALSLQGCLNDDDDNSDDGKVVVETGPVAETLYGPVEGFVDEDQDMLVWRGIPYAAPPLGGLRFAPPAAPEQRSEVLVTDEFGTSCIQPASTFGAEVSGEDCLYLNVYSPDQEGSYPVMVWIHGGSFETGSGDVYLPARLVDQDVVVVTVNYRLGILGFLAHPLLSAESPDTASGNYGLMDQRQALEWVQANIENFGGDPGNVTIFGESAGGHSVLSHLVSPASRGLFHKAIVQSGSYQPEQRTLAVAETLGDAFVTEVGCSTIECLRELDATEIQAAQAAVGLSFVPNTRPNLLPLSIDEALATGTYNKVPVLMGTNLDEYRLFVAIAELTRAAKAGKTPAEVALTPDDYVPTLTETLGPTLAALAPYLASDIYPLGQYENTSLAVSAVGTDSTFACSGLDQAQTLSGNVPVYAYEFQDRDAPSLIGTSNSFDLGAAHAFEIAYVFGSETELEARGFTPDQIDLANAMVEYWTQFAYTGDPNSASGTGVTWPRFMPGTGETYLALEPNAVEELPATQFATEHKCVFWMNVGSGGT